MSENLINALTSDKLMPPELEEPDVNESSEKSEGENKYLHDFVQAMNTESSFDEKEFER